MVDCTADEKGNNTWPGEKHVMACPKLKTRVECAHVTLQVVWLGGKPKSGLSTWFERVQISTLDIKACQHDITPFLSSTSSAHMATAQVSPRLAPLNPFSLHLFASITCGQGATSSS